MKFVKKALPLLSAAMLMLTFFVGCSNNSTGTNQLAQPEKGDQIAVIKVKDYGDIKLRFFPEAAPKAVENFTTHAKNGYYDGVKFHRVIKDFMAQTGDPDGNGMGGQSIWGKGFGIEIDENIRHYNGAVGAARTNQPDSIGSQFYIVYNSVPSSAEEMEYYSQNNSLMKYSDTVKKNYQEIGGAPHLDGNYTVFAQVYEGLDIIRQIMDQPTENDMPTTDIIVETIEVSEYEG